MDVTQPIASASTSEYEVWSAFLQQWLAKSPPPLILIGQSSGTHLERSEFNTPLAHAPGEAGLREETVVGFIAANRTEVRWDQQFHLHAPVRYQMLDHKHTEHFFTRRTWESNGGLEFPPLTPVYMLARPGFDPMSSQALLHVGSLAVIGDTSVGGVIEAIMTRADDGWGIASHKTLALY
jgi:hypothetical protein